VNYAHAYHAGNPADVLKHLALCLALAELTRKAGAIHAVDTHAGSGLYELNDPEGEWTQGIGRLSSRSARRRMPELSPYLDLVPSEGDRLVRYPGSPLLAYSWLRAEDRLELYEKNPEDAARLSHVVEKYADARVRVATADGYRALAALKPADARRFALVDPPFEDLDEWDRLEAAVSKAAVRCPGLALLAWYPVKEGAPHTGRPERLARALEAQKVRGLRVEMTSRGGMIAPRTDLPKSRGVLMGSGLFFVGVPSRAIAKLAAALPELARQLARPEHGAAWAISWSGWG